MTTIQVNVVGHRFTHVVPDRRPPGSVLIPRNTLAPVAASPPAQG